MNSITIPKVNVGAANQLWSDRRHNPDEMTCPIWSGRDLTGRPVSEDSHMTKFEGCHTAQDRIIVENLHRPSVSNYTTLDVTGISGNGVYESRINSRAHLVDKAHQRHLAAAQETPRFGTVSNQKIRQLTSVREADIGTRQHSRNQDRHAALAHNSRIDQAVVLGNKNNIMVPNPSGNFQYPVLRPGQRDYSDSKYITLNEYGTNIAKH